MSLDKLQEIRERRLDKQRKVVQNTKELMIAAEQKVEQCRQSLLEFHQWRLDHQEGMFKGLQGNSHTPQGMFEYRAQLEKLTQQEEDLKLTIVQAEEELKTTQDQYSQASKIALKQPRTLKTKA